MIDMFVVYVEDLQTHARLEKILQKWIKKKEITCEEVVRIHWVMSNDLLYSSIVIRIIWLGNY